MEFGGVGTGWRECTPYAYYICMKCGCGSLDYAFSLVSKWERWEGGVGRGVGG